MASKTPSRRTPFVLLGIAALVASASGGEAVVGTAATPPEPLPTVSLVASQTQLTQAEQGTILALHNKYRAEVGVAPLSWDATLAAHAQTWADLQAAGTVRGHGNNSIPESGGALREGENITGAGPDRMTEGWYSEKQPWFDAGKPNVSFSAAIVTGHYTQMVWNTTTKLGCGYAKNSAGTTFSVCRYAVQGNEVYKGPFTATVNPPASTQYAAGTPVTATVGSTIPGGKISTTATATTAGPPATTSTGPTPAAARSSTATGATATGSGGSGSGGSGSGAGGASACPDATTDVTTLRTTESSAALRCVISEARSRSRLPALNSNSAVDSIALSVAQGGSSLTGADRICLRPAGSGSTIIGGAVDGADSAQQAFTRAGGLNAKTIGATSGTYLGIGVSGRNFGLVLVTCK